MSNFQMYGGDPLFAHHNEKSRQGFNIRYGTKDQEEIRSLKDEISELKARIEEVEKKKKQKKKGPANI